MKFLKKIMVSLMVLLVLAGAMPNKVMAADENDKHLTLETNIDKSLEIPLTLNGSTDNFYVNANINPGDIMTADVVFKNTSSEAIQVRISDITDQLNTTESAALLEVLDLTITTDGSPIYKGSHKNVTTPLTQWMTLEGGSVLTMNIRIEFPKYEADNSFQGAEMKIKYVFEARADVPMDDIDNPEKVKTGVEDESSSNPAAIALIGIAVIVLVVFVVITITKKNKKNDEE